jgi:hypothetical protein
MNDDMLTTGYEQEKAGTLVPFHSEEIAAALHALHVDSVRYLAGLSAREIFAAQGSKWSPAEHVRHLTKSVRPMARALTLPRLVLLVRFGRNRGPSRSFPRIREAYRARLARGYGANPYAPSKRPAPADVESGRREIMDQWTASLDALVAAIPAWRDGALDRYRLPHPLLGTLTVREMLFFTLYHNAHHIRLVAERRSETPSPAPGTSRGDGAVGLDRR